MSMRNTANRATIVVMLVLSGALPSHTLYAQEVRATHSLTTWTGTNGFTFGDTWAIAQDTTGYLWLGTSLGLVRFDGVRFVPFSRINGIPLNTYATAVTATGDGSVWVGLATGIVRVRGDEATMYNSDRGFRGGVLSRIVEDGSGTLWTTGTGGIWRFQHGRWEQMGSRDGLPERASWTLFIDPHRTLWAATAEGIFRRAVDDDVFQQVTRSRAVVNAIAVDAGGSLWATDPMQTVAAVVRDGKQRGAPLTGFGAANELLLDRPGRLWVGTQDRGLLRMPPAEQARGQIAQLTQRDGLATNSIRELFEDREGNIWIGMLGGLARLAEKTVTSLAEGDAISSVAATADGSVWIGTESGLIRVIHGRQLRYSVGEGLPASDIRALHTDSAGVLWVATNGGGLATWTAERFRTVVSPRGLSIQRITALASDRGGTLWGTDLVEGLFRVAHGVISSVSTPDLQPLTAASMDRAGKLWLGQLLGDVAVYSAGQFDRYPSVRDENATVTTIYEDSHGDVWIGMSTGLGRFENGRVVPLRNEHFASGVLAIVEDSHDQLWIATRAGIVRANLPGLARLTPDSAEWADYRVYDAADGLPGQAARAFPSAVRSIDGSLWFVTTNGAARIDSQRLRERRAAPPIRIEAVIADDQARKPQPHTALPSGTSRIEIQYAVMTLNSASGTTFLYKLDGYDSDWVRAGIKREAVYTNLAPRPYRFRVTTTRAGVSNETVWDFSIAPRFYQTRLFMVAVFGAVAVMFSISWRLRVLHLRKQFALVLAERTRIAREIHDTLLQGLAGIAVQIDGISRQPQLSPDGTKQRLDKIRLMVGRYIRETRSSIWLLRSESLEERDLPTLIRDRVEDLCTGAPICLKLDVVGRPARLQNDVTCEVIPLVNEAVLNVLKHAGASELHVTLRYQHDGLAIQVSDNGCGFDPSTRTIDGRTGFGLIGMEERAKRIGAVLKVSSAVGRGTQIDLIIPA